VDPDGSTRIHEDPSGSKGSRICFFPLDKLTINESKDKKYKLASFLPAF
jgi:hypothetical protein